MVLSNDAVLVATSKNNIPAAKDIPFIAVNISRTGSRNVTINSYLYKTSTTGRNLEMAKIIYNSIYWCLKLNN